MFKPMILIQVFVIIASNIDQFTAHQHSTAMQALYYLSSRDIHPSICLSCAGIVPIPQDILI